MKNKLLIITIFTFAFSACISPWKGEEGTLTISLGRGGRYILENSFFPEILERLEYEITLSGNDTAIPIKAKGGDTISATVAAGRWEVKIDAYITISDEDKIGGYEPGDRAPFATGTNFADVKAGRNNTVPVPMSPFYFTVRFEIDGETPFEDKVLPGDYPSNSFFELTKQGYVFNGWYNDQGFEKPYARGPITKNITLYANWTPDNGIYLIAGGERTQCESLADALMEGMEIDGEEVFVSIYDDTHLFYSDNDGNIDKGKTVIIENRGSGIATIKLDTKKKPKGCIFSVNGELTLQGNITLDGRDNDNNSALIVVNEGATFNMGREKMNDNVVITGNKNNDPQWEGYGGGVRIYDTGTFNMHSGEISDNNSYSNGGGVFVGYGGTFKMFGGTITGNTAAMGGGVYVEVDGIFNWIAGTINGNTSTNDNDVDVFEEQ